MSVTKKYDVGVAVLDSPYYCYKHNLEMVSFGGITGRVSVGVSYNSGYDQYLVGSQTNCFYMVNGLKLSLHKKIIQNSGRTFLIDENGSFEQFSGASKLDPSRELISNNGTYEIRDSAGRVEYYNSNGDITLIRQYLSNTNYYDILTYTYSNNKLTQVTDRLNRKIVLSYNGAGNISKISLQTSNNVEKWYADIAYGTNTVTIAMCNGVDIVYGLSNGNAEIYTKQNGGSYNNIYGQKIICEKVSSTEIKIRKLFGDRVDENISYMLINGILDNPNVPVLEFLETKNNLTNVRSRTQFDGLKPQYTYEAPGTDAAGDDMFNMSGSLFDSFKCDVAIAKENSFLGKIRTYYQISRAYLSGGSYGTIYNFHSVPFVSGKLNFYSLSGWVKPSTTNVNVTIEIANSQYGGTFKSFVVSRPSSDTKWRFFHFDFVLSSNNGSEWYVRQDMSNFAVLGDVRITHIEDSTLYNRGVLVKKVPNGTNDKIYLCDIVGCVYTQNMNTITDNTNGFFVTYTDIHKRLLNLAKDSSDNRLYLRDSATVQNGCTNIRFIVSGVGTIDLSNYNIGFEYDNNRVQVTNSVSFGSGTAFKVVYENVSGGYTASNSRSYNMAGQILQETVNGITNTYTRNTYGVVTKVETSVSGSTNKIEKTYSYDQNNDCITQYTNENGIVTSYVVDGFWGVVTSETCNSTTKAYDFDTNRKQITKITRTNGANSFVLDTSDTDLVTSGSDNYSLHHMVEGSSAVCDKQSVCGRLTKVKYGSSSGSLSLSEITYDDTAKTETDSYAGTTLTYDNYDRVVGKSFSSSELSMAYNIPEYFDTNRPGYACDKLAKVIDYIDAVATKITYNSADKPTNYETRKTSNNTLVRNTNLSYDSLNRLTQEETVVGSKNSKFAYAYSSQYPQEAKVTSVQHYLNSTLEAQSSFAYGDAFRRVSSHVKNNGPYTISQAFGYAVSGTRDYNRLASASETLTYGGNTTTLYNIQFGYTSDGKISSLTDSANSGAMSSSYEYDVFGRLTRENNKPRNATYTYTYNSNGTLNNVKTYAYTTDTLGTPTSTKNCSYNSTYPTRLISFNSKAIIYNTAGGVLTYDGFTYKWAKGRITGYTYGNSLVGTENHTYYYNGKGQRVGKHMKFTKGKQTLISYEVMRDEDYTYDDNGRMLKWYKESTFNDFSTSERSMDFFYDASGVAGFSYYNGTTSAKYYFTKNVFGDIISIRDASGNVVGTYTYDAFGNCTVNGYNDVLQYNPFRYRGYVYDQDTKLYFLENRYYCPEWHRFMSPDHPSYIDAEQLNCLDLYAYCGNDPVNYVDPSGTDYLETNFVLMQHYTYTFIRNKWLGMIFGNISYTETVSFMRPKTFFTFHDYGNDVDKYGVGFNLSSWYGVNLYYTNNLGVGFNMQITPWFTHGIEISFDEGVSFSFGVNINDVNHEISFNIGWGSMTLLTASIMLATMPGVASKIAAGLLALVAILYN